jgi:hypothetical protein
MRSNLIIAVLALLGAFIATEYNQYSHCREWRLELELREQGIAPDRSWGAATVDFVAGDLIAVGEKWQCGIEINRREAAWAAVEALTLVPALGSVAGWVVRTAGRGFARMGVLLREATVARGVGGFVQGPMALIGKITVRRMPLLVFGGALLAVYFADGQLLLDALSLLPWIVQLALWTTLLCGLGKCVWFATRAASASWRGLRRVRWRSGVPQLVAKP